MHTENTIQVMSGFHELNERILRTGSSPVLLSNEEIDSLTEAEIGELTARYGGYVLMKLPSKEQDFFEWLKREDPEVWHDLWDEDEELLVTLAFLPALRGNGNGFLICDLVQPANYFFTSRHIKPNGLEAAQTILAKAELGGDLSIGEALMVEILSAPIDIWHFCYKYGVPISRAKQVVQALVEHDWLVHLSNREDLVQYIEGESRAG